MLTHEYVALKETLVQGCMVERMEFIQSFGTAQLSEFIDRLELFASDRLAENTWRFLAKILAIRSAEYVAKVDGLAPCADPCGCDGTCTPCEMAEDEAQRHTGAIAYEVEKELTAPLVGMDQQAAEAKRSEKFLVPDGTEWSF